MLIVAWHLSELAGSAWQGLCFMPVSKFVVSSQMHSVAYITSLSSFLSSFKTLMWHEHNIQFIFLKQALLWHSVPWHVVPLPPSSSSRIFLQQTKTLCPYPTVPQPLSSQSLANTVPLSASRNLIAGSDPCQWSHRIFVLLYHLVYFTKQNVLHCHPCCRIEPSFLLFCGWVILLWMSPPWCVGPFIQWWTFRLFPPFNC